MSIAENNSPSTQPKADNDLSGNALMLIRFLSFLNPDNIHGSLLKDGASHVESQMVYFMRDEAAFSQAEQALLDKSSISKGENGIIRVTETLQEETRSCMSNDEQKEIFRTLIDILAANLPDTYSTDMGHQVASWAQCARSVVHLEVIDRIDSDYKFLPAKDQPYAEFILRCCWYLYEREDYTKARYHLEKALRRFPDQSSLAYAGAIDLRGLIDLDACRFLEALKAFEAAQKTRSHKNGDLVIASEVNIGLAYTEKGQLSWAKDFLQSSINRRLACSSNRIGNSYSNMASLLLRMGQPDRAEGMLRRCPSLKEFTDETFLRTGNPRFAGDMVLLSRIRSTQGRHDEALKLAYKALDFRRGCLGNGLRVSDSLYHIACLHGRSGSPHLALEPLQECQEIITKKFEPLDGSRHAARAQYKLSQIMKALGREEESAEQLNLAQESARVAQLDGDSTNLESIENIGPWMLW